MAREMPTNNAPDPISQARAAARIAPRSVTPRTTQIGMDALSGNANSSFPNVLSDALQGLDPSLSGTADGFGTPGQPSATNPLAALANMAGLSGLQGLGAGASALGLSGIPGLGGLAGMTGATQAPASPAGQTAVDTALGYLGRHDWNNYCERFVEVCYGTQNLYPNAASTRIVEPRRSPPPQPVRSSTSRPMPETSSKDTPRSTLVTVGWFPQPRTV